LTLLFLLLVLDYLLPYAMSVERKNSDLVLYMTPLTNLSLPRYWIGYVIIPIDGLDILFNNFRLYPMYTVIHPHFPAIFPHLCQAGSITLTHL
jgi:hypothetical protein